MMCPVAQRRGRIALARLVADEGGNLHGYARLLGMSPSGALKWLRHHAPEELRELTRFGRGAPGHGAGVALVRLLLFKAVEDIYGGQSQLARVLGMTSQNIVGFRKRWAPDGLDAAIADLMPEGRSGKHELNSGFKRLLTRPMQVSAHG